MKEKNAVLTAYLAVLAFALAWLAGIFLAPYLRGRSSPLAALIYGLYSPVCHQIPSRSFFLGTCPLAVCGRCLGIYMGFLLGTIVYPFLRGFRLGPLPDTRLFILATGPIGFDTLVNFLRVWRSPNGLRLATGILWGAVLPFYLVTGLGDFIRDPGFRSKRG